MASDGGKVHLPDARVSVTQSMRVYVTYLHESFGVISRPLLETAALVEMTQTRE